MTESQKSALRWLEERGGDGVFDRNGVLLVRGESAPFTRTTWNALAKLGYVEFYNPAGKGRGRLRMSANQQSRGPETRRGEQWARTGDKLGP